MSALLTKRNFPEMSRFVYDFEQVFGPVERLHLKEGENEYGQPWQGQGVVPVLEQRNKK